jgi:glucan 1,3-beta-glucosidase
MGAFVQGDIYAAHKPSVLLDGSGKIFGKTHPQYADYSVTQFISVRDHGAKGDGKTDDTAALRDIFRNVRVRVSILANFLLNKSLMTLAF